MRRSTLSLTPLETRDTPAGGFTVAGAAAGGLPLVAVLRADGSTVAQFSAFESSFRGGVRAAAAELDGNPNTQEVVAAAGPGGGPAVKVFSVNVQTGAVTTLSAFYAFEPSFTGGVHVAAGNVTGRTDGVQQIILGAGDGGGPRVRVVDVGGNPVSSPLSDFFAYESSFRGGVQVAAGELDGNTTDGDELVVAAGEGGGPRVRVFRSDGAVLADYYAFDSGFRGGASVTVSNTGGVVGVIVPDAYALDPSQRNTALTTAAYAGAQQSSTTTTTGITGVNGLGSVSTIGGSVSNIGGTTTSVGGGVTDISGATSGSGLSAATGQTGIASGTGGIGGVGTTTTSAGGISSATGTSGISSSTGIGGSGTVAVNGLGASGATGSTGINSTATGTTGISGSTASNGITTTATGTTGISGATATTGVTGNTLGTGLTTTTGTPSVPSPTAFGPFGDPGTAIATPVLNSLPFLLGPARYTIMA